MEAGVEAKRATKNSCCSKWERKYVKEHDLLIKFREALKKQNVLIDGLNKEIEDLKVKADAERQEKEKLAHEISELKSEMLSLQQRGGSASQEAEVTRLKELQSHILGLEAEVTRLKELAEKNSKEADTERLEKVQESEKRVSLEHDISALKSEILLLQKNGSAQAEMNGEVMVLRNCVSEMETEVKMLKECADKEKMKGDAERQCKEHELTKRMALEHEISDLKLKMISMQQSADSQSQEVQDRVLCLQSRNLEFEAAVAALKELADTNKMVADSERLEKESESTKRVKLEHDIAKLEYEVQVLKQVTEKKEMVADAERNEQAEIRVSLEREISELKSKLLSLEQSGASEGDEGVEFLRSHISALESEIIRLKEAAEKKTTEADYERQEKVNESTKRVSLEKDISVLKSEVLLLQQVSSQVQEKDGEIICLKSQISEFEKEVNGLKELVKKEKTKADYERQEKVNESTKRVSLEKDISVLKAEILPLQQLSSQVQEKDGEIICLKSQISEFEEEVNGLKELVKKEKTKADYERQEKVNESTKRVSLEKDISVLKAEILPLQQLSSQVQEKDEEITCLKSRISEFEKEVNVLKELVKKEKTKADSERRKAEAEKKKGKETLKNLKVEQSKAAEEKRLAAIEREKAVACEYQLETLRKEADEARSKFDLESKKHEEAKKSLEAERKRANKERSHRNSAMAHAEEQKKSAEIVQKKALDEKNRADSLSQQLDEHRKTIIELQKALDELKSGNTDLSDKPSEISDLEHFKGEHINRRFKEDNQKRVKKRKRSDSEMIKEGYGKESQANKTSREEEVDLQLADKTRRLKELQKEISELVTYRTSAKSPNSMNSETFEIEMLRKQLDLEKQRVKHANEVAKFEIGRNNMIQQELCSLRQDLFRSVQHLDSLNNVFSRGAECRELEKVDNGNGTSGLSLRTQNFSKELHQTHFHHDNEVVRPSCAVTDASDDITNAIECSAPMLLTNGGNCCTSGNRMLQNSSINSSTTSFSDRPLMGSQGRGAFSVTASARLVEDQSNSQRKLFNQSVEGTNIKCNENLAVVAENSIRGSIVSIDDAGNGGHNKNRILDTVTSIEHLYSEGKKCHLQLEEKLSQLRCTLNSQVNKSLLEKKGTVDVLKGYSGDKKGRASKKRKLSVEDESALHHSRGFNNQDNGPAEKGGAVANLKYQISAFGSDQPVTAQLFEDGSVDLGKSSQEHWVIADELIEQNYLKLLDLDNEEDEELYRRAIERPLSPTLPVIEFRNSKTMPRYCIVSSNIKDSSSIGRIVDAAGVHMARCSMDFQIDQAMQKIISPLLLSEDLSLKEKGCVLFSVLLHNMSERAVHSSAQFCNAGFIFLLDSLARCLKKEISDVKTRGVFAELCLSGELLTLIEDFLLDRRVLFYGAETSESLSICGSRIHIPLDEAEVTSLCAIVQSHQLLAASLILASICESMDHTGFLCEVSYNILMFSKLDISHVLTILHVFGYVSGFKYFNHSKQSLLVTVLKSLVTFLEKQDCTSEYSCCLQFSGENPQEVPSECPFSESAISVDDAVSLLFENLQRYTLPGSGNKCLLEPADTLNSGMQPNSSHDEDLYRFTDLISLVELIVCKMSWDWTCNNILSQMLSLLDLPLPENFTIASVIFLGKLGRMGVDANGPTDKGVVKLKRSLFAFLSQKISSSEFGFPLQIAIVNAVLGLLPARFKEIVGTTPSSEHNLQVAAASEVDPSVGCIRRWYSGLSTEERSVSLSLL